MQRARLAWFSLRRNLPALPWSQTLMASEIGRGLMAVLLPGAGFFLMGRQRIGAAVLAGYCCSVLAFLAFLGTSLASVAAGSVVGLHTISACYWLYRNLSEVTLATRVWVSLISFLLIFLALYLPASRMVGRSFALPLRTPGGVVVVNLISGTRQLNAGDLVAYRIEGEMISGTMFVAGGYGLDPLLAGPGDTVEFTRNSFRVNGRAFPLLKGMPAGGATTVPEKHWFIWPASTTISGVGLNADVADVLVRHAMVPEEQIYGKPFNRWFWRRQVKL